MASDKFVRLVFEITDIKGSNHTFVFVFSPANYPKTSEGFSSRIIERIMRTGYFKERPEDLASGLDSIWRGGFSQLA